MKTFKILSLGYNSDHALARKSIFMKQKEKNAVNLTCVIRTKRRVVAWNSHSKPQQTDKRSVTHDLYLLCFMPELFGKQIVSNKTKQNNKLLNERNTL